MDLGREPTLSYEDRRDCSSLEERALLSGARGEEAREECI
jgi:hypothetical protein